MGQVLLHTSSYDIFSCWSREGCGVHFAVDENVVRNKRARGETLFCPNGHRLSLGKSDRQLHEEELAEKQRQIENLSKRMEWEQQETKQQRERALRAENRTRSVRGHVTRLRKRLSEGKCPCCEQEFPDMAAHIAEKHPRYKPREPKS